MTLKEWMKDRRWKSMEIAQKLGVSVSFISLLANGHRMPGPALMSKIGRMTGHTVTLQDFAKNYSRDAGAKASDTQVIHTGR